MLLTLHNYQSMYSKTKGKFKQISQLPTNTHTPTVPNSQKEERTNTNTTYQGPLEQQQRTFLQ